MDIMQGKTARFNQRRLNRNKIPRRSHQMHGGEGRNYENNYNSEISVTKRYYVSGVKIYPTLLV